VRTGCEIETVRCTSSASWMPASLAKLIHNPVYKGVSPLLSRNGTVERPVPPLVDDSTWDAAQLALTRKRNHARKNRKRDYPLNGLVRCGACGGGYSGRTVTSGGSYKESPFRVCNAGKGVRHPTPEHRCRGKAVSARTLETEVWSYCHDFIEHPEEHPAGAQRQLRAQVKETSGLERQRQQVLLQLTEKEGERERVPTLFRRDSTTLAETETQFGTIAHEAATLRELLESLRPQEALVKAQEGPPH
jgi:hypothetical protein